MNARFITRFRLVSAALALSAGSALAADYYVATTGDDGADGTQSAPFATLGAAVAAADAAIAGGDTDATIHVAAGTFTGAARTRSTFKSRRGRTPARDTSSAAPSRFTAPARTPRSSTATAATACSR